MTDTDAGNLRTDHCAEGSVESEPEERQPGKPHDKWGGIDGCRKKLLEDAEATKILERLTGRGPTLVDDAVDILVTSKTTRDAKVYQLFLYDVLRHSGPGIVVLCAASLGKQRVVHLAEKDRTSFVGWIKDNKAKLYSLALDSLAEEYQIPSLNDRRIAQVVGGSRKRTRGAEQSSKRPRLDPKQIPGNPVLPGEGQYLSFSSEVASSEGTQIQGQEPDHRPGSSTFLRRLLAPPKSNEEARQHSTASPAISTRHTNTPPSNETQSDPIATPETSLNDPSFTPRQEHEVLENASLQGIADVFDEYMCGAIRRDTVRSGGTPYLKAAVTMDFPLQGLVDCLMSLAIHPGKVEYLAMALFNVQVESVGNVRYITLMGGIRLTPNPEVTLKGVLDEAIIRVFGPEIHKAVAASRMRKKELEEGNHVTECVSMIVTSSSGEGAITNLSLGVKGGVQIRKKLYT